MTNPKPVTESVSDAAKNIFFDAKWYEVLWMRWTAVDWILSLLAAGTAIAAAVQNAFSNHAQAQAQAGGSSGSGHGQGRPAGDVVCGPDHRSDHAGRKNPPGATRREIPTGGFAPTGWDYGLPSQPENSGG